MKLPRDISGADLAKALSRLGYRTTRQTGSHLRLTTEEQSQHHVTIPNHDAIKVGTLAGILLMWLHILESAVTNLFDGSSARKPIPRKCRAGAFTCRAGDRR
jgi:predicted RNA binding protein YcfA (HicA-like mRNA interferase family)